MELVELDGLAAAADSRRRIDKWMFLMCYGLCSSCDCVRSRLNVRLVLMNVECCCYCLLLV